MGTFLGCVHPRTGRPNLADLVFTVNMEKNVKDSRACEPKGLSDPEQLAGIREAFLPARRMSIVMKVRVGLLQGQACDRNYRVRSHDRTGTP